MNHLDLFSGIGGFAYAVDQVWPDATHVFCEIDKFCQAVLKKHWPNSKIYGDIRGITTNPLGYGFYAEHDTEGKTFLERLKAKEENPRRGCRVEFSPTNTVDLLTGGFPCQPFSAAGKRRGTEDDRYLWPEMLRVIKLTQPKWIIAENVRGLLTQQGGLVFEQVCLDLEACGYEVQPFIIPAVAVNAPHRRDRIWIIANRKSERSGGGASQECGNEKRVLESSECQRDKVWSENKRCAGQPNVINSYSKKYRGRNRQIQKKKSLSGIYRQALYTGRFSGTIVDPREWDKNWLEVATELCGMDDGLPVELDGFKLPKQGHRVQRLKSLGNAIVPQVAVEIMKAIKKQTLL